MAKVNLYYDVEEEKFITEEETLLIVRSEIARGNLDVLTDRTHEYGFDPHDMSAKIVKFTIIAKKP